MLPHKMESSERDHHLNSKISFKSSLTNQRTFENTTMPNKRGLSEFCQVNILALGSPGWGLDFSTETFSLLNH